MTETPTMYVTDSDDYTRIILEQPDANCDRCGMKAYVAVVYKIIDQPNAPAGEKKKLIYTLLCGHHYTVNQVHIVVSEPLMVLDRRDLIPA
jgi:hypothetical protein